MIVFNLYQRKVLGVSDCDSPNEVSPVCIPDRCTSDGHKPDADCMGNSGSKSSQGNFGPVYAVVIKILPAAFKAHSPGLYIHPCLLPPGSTKAYPDHLIRKHFQISGWFKRPGLNPQGVRLPGHVTLFINESILADNFPSVRVYCFSRNLVHSFIE